MNFLIAVYENPLLFSAVLAIFAASIVAGVVGSYVVTKRISFIAGSISHSVLGGIGICLYLERVHGTPYVTPMLGALVSALLSALLLGWIKLSYKQREDSIIASIWAVGMAIGVLFISKTPGYNLELNNYLLGNILWVSKGDLYTLYLLDVFVLLTVAFTHKRFLAICFDEEHASLRGVHVSFFYYFLLILVAISVVLLIQVVGIVLIMAMLVIPASIANLFTYRLSKMMFLAVLISSFLSFFGFFLAFHFDLPAGATISLLCGVVYLLSLLMNLRKV